MRLSASFIVPALVLITAIHSFSQVNIFRPEIIGQTPSPLSTEINKPITIELGNLIVLDADLLPVYPNGFTLEVRSGTNYEVEEATVTPDEDFTGMLSVPVRVDDGRHRSRLFDLQIEVTGKVNEEPEITGQEPLAVTPGETLTIELSHLKVEDPDNTYPDDFTLKVFNGNNYTVNGNAITARSNFTGNLKVPVSVNDGQNESDKFELTVEVARAENVAPQITGQENLSTNEEAPFTLKLSDIKVEDPDNDYPDDFTLTINPGQNYSVSGSAITPAANFTGTLAVEILVNDGESNSPAYSLQLNVNPVNDPPTIIRQVDLTTQENTAIAINLGHLTVTDPDNKYPDDFTMKIAPGDNYSVSGNNIINPFPDFDGELTVNVTVSDGIAESKSFPLKITVAPSAENVPPVITGQKAITIVENTSLLILLSHLSVKDPDNKYPSGFSLKVLPGDNYTVEGTTIKPLPAFTNNTLFVSVAVNDGTDDSAPFSLKIQVIPSSSKPIINGQKEISVAEDNTIEITLGHLEVTDNDNLTYPKGFSLTVMPGDQAVYTTSGSKVTPALNLNGFIEVGVKVSDGVNSSDEFKLSILVSPVNDAPEILNFESSSIGYKPGSEPVDLFSAVDLSDVDNDHISMAEIGFRETNYSAVNDEFLFTGDSTNIKAIYDPQGILFLVGYATLDEYETLIKSIRYNYKMTQDENGNPSQIISGTRTIYISLHDGQAASEVHERQIEMETKVSLDIPNTFTPNGDNANDTWRIHATNIDQLENMVVRVYNKKGLLIYESIGFENEWDGVSNGQALPVDTYYYTIDLNLSYMKQTYKGAVTILH